uniref:Delta5-desaturase 2 n=1 Tax=Tigriopus japonicus TaxID=158387 RepID=A0A3S6CIU4_TIGJA|nr:delta5-desaturase 2 [Tigriopus japonicus]
MAPNATSQDALVAETAEDCFSGGHLPIGDESIRVEDKIYSAKTLANMHPGGPLFIKSFAGRDASQAFLSYHRRQFPHSRVKEALEKVDPNVKVDPHAQDDFLELCERVDKVLPRMQSFAPWSYYLKASFIMGMAFSLEFYMHYTGNYRWYISGLCGWFFALIGLNIQHDANHGALSRRSWVNRLWGLSQNWIGGSTISWIHQHVVQHHIHTNDIKLDPDIEGRVVVRLNPRKPVLKWHFLQHIYFFFIILGFGFSVILSSFTTMLDGINYTPVSKMLNRQRYLEMSWSILHFIRWIVVPLYQAPSIYTFFNCAPMYIVVGWYLSFFFTLSHNFDGVTQLDNTQPSKSLLYNQVITSSNVGGKFLCFLNGGLNYQIEHHLFPRMHHGHYPKIAPVVKQFCAEKGIPYQHFPTVSSNAWACAKHLLEMGTQDVPKSAKHLVTS